MDEDLREEAAGLLEAGADLLEQRGWCQWTSSDEEGRMCAMGAIQAAVRTGSFDLRSHDYRDGRVHWAYRAADLAFREVRYRVEELSGIRSVTDWNDEPDRRAEDVVMMLRKSAIAVRERVD